MFPDWSTWKPGDVDAEFIAGTTGWLSEGLKNQKIKFPGSEKCDLDAISRIVASGLGGGLAETKIVKNVCNEIEINKVLATNLVHFATCLARCQRALGEYDYKKDAKIQWDSAGCCEFCNKNDGIEIVAGDKFPTGHNFPPACEYCICDILPSII
jgi:hypothetical protein